MAEWERELLEQHRSGKAEARRLNLPKAGLLEADWSPQKGSEELLQRLRRKRPRGRVRPLKFTFHSFGWPIANTADVVRRAWQPNIRSKVPRWNPRWHQGTARAARVLACRRQRSLDEADGDAQRAQSFTREDLKGVRKREGRSTAEGAHRCSRGERVGHMVELETDRGQVRPVRRVRTPGF